MKYTKMFNKVRGEWWIFRNTTNDSTLVKVCKTEKAADKWIATH